MIFSHEYTETIGCMFWISKVPHHFKYNKFLVFIKVWTSWSRWQMSTLLPKFLDYCVLQLRLKFWIVKKQKLEKVFFYSHVTGVSIFYFYCHQLYGICLSEFTSVWYMFIVISRHKGSHYRKFTHAYW